MIPLHAQLQWKSKYYNPRFWSKSSESVKLTTQVSRPLIVDSFNKFYLFSQWFSGWLNESSIMIYWHQQITKLANKWQFSCDKLFCNLLSRVSTLLPFASERTLNLLNSSHAWWKCNPKFLVTFVQLWWFSIVDTWVASHSNRLLDP